MQSLNVLVVSSKVSKYIEKIKASKYLNKLYVTSDEVEGTIQLGFNTFKELAQKCRTLQIDVVLVEEEKWVLEGISNVMKQYYINCFAVTSDWTELALSHNYARKMLTKYDIDVPPKINLPVEFPVVVKGDGVLKKAYSMQEIISIKESVFKKSGEIAKNVFLERYINGEKYKVTSVFDGKHLLTFSHPKVDSGLLKEYSLKIEKMLTNEKAKFIGFINSEVVEENGVLYNTGFSFELNYPDTDKDILYICLSAIYQKLNEIKFLN